MSEHEHHEHLIADIGKEYAEILGNSEQGIYIYLDDTHKLCNEKFAKLLGYSSADEWAKSEGSFTDLFVDEQSQQNLVSAYQKAMEKLAGSQIDVNWKKKDGGSVKTEIILVPVSFGGEVFALHFVTSE